MNSNNKRSISSPESEISQIDKSRKMDASEFMKAMKSMEMSINQNMSQQINGLSQSINTIGNSVKGMEANLATLFERLEKYEKALESLRNDFMELEARFNDREQNDLINHFRFTGMPPVAVSPVGQIECLIKMCTLVGVTATTNDFEDVRMYTNRNKTAAVIAGKFSQLGKRREVFKAFKEKMKTSEITWSRLFPGKEGDSNAMRKLGLFSSLTKYTMNLKASARETGKFAYVWETEGRVLLRKKEGEKTIRVKSLMELQRAANLII